MNWQSNNPSKRQALRVRLLSLLAAMVVPMAMSFAAASATAEELNVLAWCDHLDPALVEPFEDAHDVRVNMKEYEGTGTALAIVEQSQPGDWDVLVVDSTDIRRIVDLGLLAELDPADYPWDDIPEAIADPNLHYVDGKLYAVPEKFGYNNVAYNKTKVDPEDMRRADVLWDPKYKGRTAIYDYYLSIISQVAIAIGKTPSTLTDEDLDTVREKLFLMKENSALVSDIVTSQTALATGDVDILIGGGEYAVAGLMVENPDLDWVLPVEGGVRWQQAIGIFADSERKDLATAFVQHVLSPEGQAAIATSSCYWGMPANSAAALTDAQKTILRWDEQPDFIANSHTYPALTNEFDAKLQEIWTEFLQH